MTGSGLNFAGGLIVSGMAVAEDQNGNLIFPDPATPAIAVATSGSIHKQVTEWTTEGIVSLPDWSRVIGSKLLTKGTTYYVGINGRLVSSGTQQIGIARSSTDLRLSIQPIQVQSSRFWPVNGQPANSMGDVGDVAYDVTRAVLYGPKRATGWVDASYLLKIDMPSNAPVMAYGTLSGLWQWQPRSS